MILYQQETKLCYIFYIINYLIKYYNILFDYFKMNKKKYIKDYINNEYCLKSIKQNNNYMKILNILLIINQLIIYENFILIKTCECDNNSRNDYNYIIKYIKQMIKYLKELKEYCSFYRKNEN